VNLPELVQLHMALDVGDVEFDFNPDWIEFEPIGNPFALSRPEEETSNR
jgi:hypothetical protein